MMTQLLERAFAEAAKLPDGEQESLARWLLHELASEQRWYQTFQVTADALAQLADEALDEHSSSHTLPLDK